MRDLLGVEILGETVYNKHKMNKKREKQERGKWQMAWGISALLVFGCMMIGAVLAMKDSIFQLQEVEVAKAPTAQLASAGVKESTSVALPVKYYDQWSDLCEYDDGEKLQPEIRQFEWTLCGYNENELEQGLVLPELGPDGLPVAATGQKEANQAINMEKWFGLVEGETEEQSGTLQLRYDKDGAKFTFGADDFYPMEGVEFSKEDKANKDGHNRLFTMQFSVPFVALVNGGEQFTVTMDDDTFVFVNDRLVVDMGGVHDAMTGVMAIDDEGKVMAKVDDGGWKDSGVRLAPGEKATVEVFHADRDSKDSTIQLEFAGMNLMLDDGVQIANANKVDDGYAAPLGVSGGDCGSGASDDGDSVFGED